ncbi:fluoride efflux transporter FluC [Alicyclobacillus macrosporangiidus]|uniref:Fluoride-specific ion channel FluC n=1 Tax=Alicyclobacillus macrosporangiidus TaxID=392015 RepID=A0A1I7JBS3_9BACL|nr:CrcB family protein [Alicyclobacillus macrosporangiidus]SFU82677.1 CrcB protein [Alicyclobacillus macrosporangiidus]
MNVLAIALFGAVGGVLRLLLEDALPSSHFPFATLVMNLMGSFALGHIAVVAIRKAWPDWLRLGIGTGMIGSFTTFSTFSMDVLTLFHTSLLLASIYVLASLLGGWGCALAGDRLAVWIYTVDRTARVTEPGEMEEVYP